MLDISSALISEKNSLSSSYPFLILCEIQFTGYTARLVKNEADIEWQGNIWYAFPFDIDNMGEQGRDEVPEVRLTVSNAMRSLQGYVDTYDGGVEVPVVLRVVHADNLIGTENDTTFLRLDYEILTCTADSKVLVFTLGSSSPWHRRIPRCRFRRNLCRWKFKSTSCGYGGVETECNKSFARCDELNNTARFGGFPTIGNQGIRLNV